MRELAARQREEAELDSPEEADEADEVDEPIEAEPGTAEDLDAMPEEAAV